MERERKWRARDALETLSRAADIKKDSALMRDVKKLAVQQVKAVSSSGRRK